MGRMSRRTYRYHSHNGPWTELRMRISREGWKVGKYLVERIYREEGLTLRQRRKRRGRVAEHGCERSHPTAPLRAQHRTEHSA